MGAGGVVIASIAAIVSDARPLTKRGGGRVRRPPRCACYAPPTTHATATLGAPGTSSNNNDVTKRRAGVPPDPPLSLTLPKGSTQASSPGCRSSHLSGGITCQQETTGAGLGSVTAPLASARLWHLSLIHISE